MIIDLTWSKRNDNWKILLIMIKLSQWLNHDVRNKNIKPKQLQIIYYLSIAIINIMSNILYYSSKFLILPLINLIILTD